MYFVEAAVEEDAKNDARYCAQQIGQQTTNCQRHTSFSLGKTRTALLLFMRLVKHVIFLSSQIRPAAVGLVQEVVLEVNFLTLCGILVCYGDAANSLRTLFHRLAVPSKFPSPRNVTSADLAGA